MNPMLSSLVGGKMSSSDPAHTKVMFLDGPETVQRKISGAYCQEGDIATNGILPILKEILIPISEFRSKRLWRDEGTVESQRQENTCKPFCSEDAPEGTLFTIPHDSENGWETKHYKSYEEIEHDFAERKLLPATLKASVADAIDLLLAPIREAYAQDEAWQAVDKLAYPSDPDYSC